VLLCQAQPVTVARPRPARWPELASCTFEHFPDVGHGIHNLQPFAFCRSVRAFLASLP